MTSNISVAFFSPKMLITLAVAASSCLSSMSQAQQVYRIVGPDGKVSFSDQAPPVAPRITVEASTTQAAPSTATAALPFELRQLVAKYPVIFYSGDNCEPCTAGRALLTQRGIPFTEKTVNTAEDTTALKRLSGAASLPVMSLGNQQLKGFSNTEWAQYLTAAGYPATSALPASYHAPAPTPLVIPAPPAPAASAAGLGKAPVSAPPIRRQVQPAAENSGDIRF
ncbi:hypothetical protein AwPolaro_07380 [Polaromonas sp.]|nr:hypothetical protein AwPolaro_07380 [Polaromonas sp.]